LAEKRLRITGVLREMRFIHVRMAIKWLKITGMKKEKQYFPRNKTVGGVGYERST
jgi:hypothetical protein